jgi:hypothetical protein
MTTALEGVRGQRHDPAAFYSQERPGTNCTGGWVGPRTGLDRCENPRPHRDSISGPSSPYPFAIPNTLPGPPIYMIYCWILFRMKNISHKVFRENQTYTSLSINFFAKSCRLWDNGDKWGTTRQTTVRSTIRHMRFVCWKSKATDIIIIFYRHWLTNSAEWWCWQKLCNTSHSNG